MTLNIPDPDEEESEPPPVALWYPLDYALTTWNDHDKYGTYPAEGGYNAQDEALMADWSLLNARYNFWFEQWLREKNAGDEFDKLTGAQDSDVPRGDWAGLME